MAKNPTVINSRQKLIDPGPCPTSATIEKYLIHVANRWRPGATTKETIAHIEGALCLLHAMGWVTQYQAFPTDGWAAQTNNGHLLVTVQVQIPNAWQSETYCFYA